MFKRIYLSRCGSLVTIPGSQCHGFEVVGYGYFNEVATDEKGSRIAFFQCVGTIQKM
jgi:hypothetical protein